MVDNPERLQAAGLGQLVKAAQGDVIVRMDVHCEYAPDYVRKCVETLEATGADNVGGAQRAKAERRSSARCAPRSRARSASVAPEYRSADAEGFVDTVFLGAFRRKVFETVGLWDPKAITNEDTELNQRILEAGGKIYPVARHRRALLPARLVARRSRSSTSSTAAAARAPCSSSAGSRRSARFLPFFMVVGGATLLALPPLWPLAPAAVRDLRARDRGRGRARRPHGSAGDAVPTVWAIFPVLHISHGIGFAAGLWQYLRTPDWPDEPERIGPKKVQLRAI